MILLDDSRYADEINYLSRSDPYGCRIAALYNTYDYTLPFADYWVQFIEDEPVSLLARLDATFVLRLTEQTDTEEISAFLSTLGADTVICDGLYEIDCGLERFEGPILTASTSFPYDDSTDIIIPTAKEVYNIISRCASDCLAVPDYESFMLDVGNKLAKNTARMFALGDSEPVSCVMTLAESEDSALIGAVATLPEYRRGGLGGRLVKHMVNTLLSEGKRVFLHRAQNENIGFYSELGFTQCGIWSEYRRER